MPHNSPPDQHPMKWLNTEQTASTLMLTAQRLLAMEKQMRTALPANLATQVRVAGYDQGALTLICPHAATAAKTRQMTSSIRDRLLEGGWNVHEVLIRVSPSEPDPAQIAAMAPRQTQPLSEHDLTHFEQLSKNLQPGALSDAVRTLVNRHRQGCDKS